MARAILVVAFVAWLLAGIAGIGLAAFGAESLERMLPPLAIDTDALRGAITAVAAGLLALAALHAAVLAGLRASRRWASTAGILMGSGLGMLFVAFAVAGATSAVADPPNATWLLLASVAAALAAIGYAVVAARLVGELRSRAGL